MVKETIVVGKPAAITTPMNALEGRRLAEAQAAVWGPRAQLVEVSAFESVGRSVVAWTYRFRHNNSRVLFVRVGVDGILEVEERTHASWTEHLVSAGRVGDKWIVGSDVGGPAAAPDLVLRALDSGRVFWIQLPSLRWTTFVTGQQSAQRSGRTQVFDGTSGKQLFDAERDEVLEELGFQSEY
jgi:hypothetical protein